jgi:putative ABC transport system ATP-binding protein
MATLVEIDNVRKVYKRDAFEVPVLNGVTVDVPRGDFLALMGPSGSGKTTLLNLIAGIDRPTAGRISVDGKEISRFSETQLASWRSRHVGFIFQMYNLIPVLNAFENVELPLLLTKLSKKERREHVQAALGIVGLGDRSFHYPRQLSGGQEQRVAIARAIVSDPTFLLCDEPTGDLDRKSADEIMELIHRLVKEHGKTVLMVTHDPVVANQADTTLHLEKGVLVESREQQRVAAGGME